MPKEKTTEGLVQQAVIRHAGLLPLDVREVQSNLQVQSSLVSLPVLPFRQAGAVTVDSEVNTKTRTLHTLNVSKHLKKMSQLRYNDKLRLNYLCDYGQ